MQFTLTGFKEDLGFRVFSFERVAADRTRTYCSIKANMTLARNYGIRVQELPLICRDFLERHDQGIQQTPLIFTEDDMRIHAELCATTRNEAAKRRKPPRRTPSPNTGAAWRAPQP